MAETRMSENGLSVLFSNLSKAAEKQQLSGLSEKYSRLSEQYESAAADMNLAEVKDALSRSLAEEYPACKEAAEARADRGILRSLVWGEKVTTIEKSLIDRYLSKGEALLEGKTLYVCEACGFIFLGADVPEICPVCKAPSSRFSVVKE